MENFILIIINSFQNTIQGKMKAFQFCFASNYMPAIKIKVTVIKNFTVYLPLTIN